jgi:hypothetical protein
VRKRARSTCGAACAALALCKSEWSGGFVSMAMPYWWASPGARKEYQPSIWCTIGRLLSLPRSGETRNSLRFLPESPSVNSLGLVDDIGSGIALSRSLITCFRHQGTAGQHGSNSLVLAPSATSLETNLGGAPRKKAEVSRCDATQRSRL